MSRAKIKTKYKILKSFNNRMKAEKYRDSLKNFTGRIKERTWEGKDKKRYYIQAVTRPGVKK